MMRYYAWVGLCVLLSIPVAFWVTGWAPDLAAFVPALGVAAGVAIATQIEANERGPGSPE